MTLIIAPRHVERVNEIRARLVRLGLNVGLRSEAGAAPTAPPDCVLLDSTGELQDWYAVASIVFIFLPGAKNPVAELERKMYFSLADRFLPLPMYGITVALFLGIVVLWQMRKEPRPLPAAMVSQRLQAWVGIVLALVGAAIIYVHVGMYGPR